MISLDIEKLINLSTLVIVLQYLCMVLFFVGCELAAIVYAIVGGRNEFIGNLEEVWENVANETKFIVQATVNSITILL